MGPSKDSRMRTPVGSGALAILSIAFAVLAAPLTAQNTGTLVGTVADAATGEPLSAVEVSIEGTSLAVLSGTDGSFRIEAVPAGDIVVRSERIGRSPEVRSARVLVAETTALDITLRTSPVSLDGLFVTVTGETRRRAIGNSTATIDAADALATTAPSNVSDLIRGRAAGVTVQESSGTVGAAQTIKIRGNSSIGLDNTPLIYVDGARISNDIRSGPGVGGQNTSRLNDLNPDDIESIEIVKGPSAATLYGTEAAAGVVRITTKRGIPGTTEWTYRSTVGALWDDTDWSPSAINLRNPFLIGAMARDTVWTLNLLEGIGTDQDPWRTGMQKGAGVSLRGGTEDATYFLAADWADREGSLPNNDATTRSVRANLNLAPSSNVDVAVSAGYTSGDVHLPNNDNSVLGYLGVAIFGSPERLPIVRTDPISGEEGVSTCPLAYEAAIAFMAPISAVEANFGDLCGDNAFFSGRTFDDVRTIANEQKIERFTGSTAVDFRPWDFLRARGTVGYDQFSDQSGTFIPVDSDLPFDDLSRGYRELQHFVSRNLTVEGSAEATFELAPGWMSTTTVGGQFYGEKLESASAIGRDFPPGADNVSNAVRTEGFEDLSETRTLGLFAEQELSYDDRIFLTPAVRVDDNSAFGMDLGRQAYPRVMGSWVLSEESWFPTSIAPLFRFRIAWGQSGKQPSSFAALQLLESARVAFSGQDVAGVSLGQLGNPDLKPERGSELEAGFEAELLNGRLALDFTWYDQVTTEAIVTRQVAPSSGYSGVVFDNIGEIRNSGLELGITAVAVNRPEVNWIWQLIGATNDGEVTELEEQIIFGLHGDTQRHMEGRPFGSYFARMYSVDSDGEVTWTDDRVFAGHPTPEYEGSLSSTLELFDTVTLYANLGFAGGHQLFNSTEEFQCKIWGGGTNGGTCPAIYEQDSDGDLTDAARIKAVAAAQGDYGPWIEDADFARLRAVGMRLDVPQGWLAHLGAARASLTLVAENLALFTDYSGVDPEVNFAGADPAARAEYLTLPPAQRFTGRVSITF